MSSNSETGHAVNLSNAKMLIDRCATFGPAFQPSNSSLTLANATAQWTTGVSLHSIVSNASQVVRIPINERDDAFEEADRIVVRSSYYYQSTAASAAAMKDAKGLVRKFTGSNVRRPKDQQGNADANWVSNSQQSYTKRQETFMMLRSFYASDPNYAPNEVELQIPSLTTMEAGLKMHNDNMSALLAPVKAARIDRDKLLYEEGTGLVDVMLAMKQYVKGVFGATSPEYKSISGIRFKKIKP